MNKIKNNYASVIARVLFPFKKLKGINTYEGLVALYSSDHDRLKEHRTLIIVRVSDEKNIEKVKNLVPNSAIMLSGRTLRRNRSHYIENELLFSMRTSYMIIADNVKKIDCGSEDDFPEEERNKVIIRGKIIKKSIYTFGTNSLVISSNSSVANDNEYDLEHKHKFIVDFSSIFTKNINDNFTYDDYVRIEAVFQTIYAPNHTMQRIVMKDIKKERKYGLSIC